MPVFKKLIWIGQPCTEPVRAPVYPTAFIQGFCHLLVPHGYLQKMEPPLMNGKILWRKPQSFVEMLHGLVNSRLIEATPQHCASGVILFQNHDFVVFAAKNHV